MGGITFGHLTEVQLVGFYQAQATRERKPFIAYVLHVDTTTSHFLVYRRYSQIAALAAKLHFDLAVGLPPKYAMQLYPLSKVQLQQRFDGLKAFLHAIVAHLAKQHATGLHHATTSSAGLDMQLFCDFVAHHRNRPPKPVHGDVPDWAKPRNEGTDRDSVTESEDGGLLESDGSDVESDAGSSCFRNQVVQAEGNVGALWHCVRTHQVATGAWWEATCAVFDEYKRVAAMPLLATDDANANSGPIPATRVKHEVASTVAVLQSEYAKTCEAQVLRPLQVLRHEVLPEIKHTFWTRHESGHSDTVATTRRVQQERETLQKTLQLEVQKSLVAFVALMTDMLCTLHHKLQPFTMPQLPRQRSHSTPQLTGLSGQSGNCDNHSQSTDVAQEDKKAEKNEKEIERSSATDEDLGSRLWVWGRPPSLESGTPLSLRPKQVTCLKNQPLVQVACGGEHLLYLTATGDVYTYGNDADRKSIGPPTLPDPELPTSSSFLTPQLVEEFALAKALNRGMIVQVACGAHHSVALTNTGEVYTWGSGEDGRLGHGDMRDRSVPRKVMTLLRQSVASASCGGAHTAVLTDKGSVFTFGRGRNGRLGLGDTKWRDVPHAITAFPSYVQKVVQVACGWNFTAAIGQNGHLFTWGKTGEGQCGLGYVDTDQVVPQGVQVDHNALVLVDVACGYTHTVGLTATNVMYSWGLGEYGQLGTGNVYQPVPAPVPLPLDTLRPSDSVARVYCGAFHSMAVTERHVLFGWGLNLYGACGLGHTANQDKPERIDGFSPTHDLVVACGHKYTLALEVNRAFASHHRGMEKAQVDQVPHLARVPRPRHETEEELRRVKKMWRTRILRDWDEHKDTPLTQALWRQGIPPSIRARVWPLAIGNQLKVTPEMFQIYRRRAAAYKKDRIANDEGLGTLDGGREHTLALIDTDLPRTFPSLKLFDASGPYYAFLLEVLETYACFRPDLGYIQGMSYLAAMLCLHMPHDRYLVFQCLANLMVHEHLFTFYLLDAELASVYYTLFDAFLSAQCPRLLVHLRHIGIFSCSMYLMNWLQTMFLQVLPLESAARVFDNFLLDGIVFLFRIAMAIHELLVPCLIDAEMEVVLPMLQHNVMYQEVWYTRVAEQALFDKVATIAVPSHICAALDRVINDVFFYEKRGHGEHGASRKQMASASVGIGQGKHDRRSMYAISDALNGVLGGF